MDAVTPDGFSHLCRTCGSKMTELFGTYESFPWHPLCAPLEATVPGMDYTYGDLELRESLIEIIQWADRNSTRSQQVALGCSEVGDPCDRKIAMTMAGLEHVNFDQDPWAAIVGTSIHSWLEDAVGRYQREFSDHAWMTELEVWATDWLPGHTDLYHRPTQTVLDLKNPSRSNYRTMRKNGEGPQYKVQKHLYGAGNIRAGRPVKRVGLILMPRDGSLEDMWVSTEPYSQAIVDESVARVERLADDIERLGVLDNPSLWSQIPAEPSRLCTYCPFFRPRGGRPADDTGCPGKYPVARKYDTGTTDDLF